MTIRSRAPEQLDAKSREVLERRAERLRAPPAVADEGPLEWLAEFLIGEERFALPLSVLRAVVPLRRVTVVPLSRPHVIGILRFQGQVITALSMASLLGVRGWRHDPAVLLVVDPGWNRLVALDCEEVPRPIGIRRAEIEAARSRTSRPVHELVHDGLMVNLIDLARLLDRRTGARGGS